MAMGGAADVRPGLINATVDKSLLGGRKLPLDFLSIKVDHHQILGRHLFHSPVPVMNMTRDEEPIAADKPSAHMAKALDKSLVNENANHFQNPLSQAF